MDWLLLTSGIVYVLALHAEIKLKTAKILMGMDAHLAPNPSSRIRGFFGSSPVADQ